MKANSKKQDILSCATRLFNHYGFKAIGIDRIIEESKIAKMTMYHHFSSKDEIILEVLEGLNRKLAQDILTPLEARDLPPETRVKKLVELYGNWFRSEEFYGCPFHKAMAEFPDRSHPVNLKVQAHQDLLTGFLIRTVKSKALASQILLVLEGSVIRAKVSADASAAKEAWKIISLLMKLP